MDCERVYVSANVAGYSTSQRLPRRAVPTGDGVGGRPAGGREVPASDQLAVVDDQVKDIAIFSAHAAAQRVPLKSVPARDRVDCNAASALEAASNDEVV